MTKQAAKAEPKHFRFVLRPPEGEPTTFTSTRLDTDPETGEDIPVEIERERLQDVSVFAASQDAARMQVERQIFNQAVQEAGSEDADEVLAHQWVIDSVEEVVPGAEE